MPSISSIIKGLFIYVIAPLFITAVLWVFAIPAENARRDEQFKNLQERYTRIDGELETVSGELKSKIDTLASESELLKERVFAAENRIEAIGSANPIENQCAEIMRRIDQPSPGMGHYKLDEETGESIDMNQAALLRRFEVLGCRR